MEGQGVVIGGGGWPAAAVVHWGKGCV